MPDYGGFSVAREIFQSGRMTVYAGARAGDRRTCAIKVFHPVNAAGRARADEVRAFVEAAEAQKKVAEKSRARWAPVHAHGECAEGAFFVTDYYPRSLEKVIGGRVALDLPTLHWVVGAIVRALADFERLAGRPYGNLGAANVFIGSNGRLRGAPLVLSEPAPLPADATAAAAWRAEDFRALGALIAWFVRRREQDGWPIEDGPEWNGLGRHGAAWRDFCNFLLNPNPAPADVTIEALASRFAKLGGRGAGRLAKAAMVAAPLLVLSLPFGYLRFAPFDQIPERFQDFAEQLGNLPPDVEEVPPEFGRLCSAWYEWFGGLLNELNDPVRRARWEADAYLRERVLGALGDTDTLDPRLLTGDSRNFETLGARPPAAAKRGSVVRRVLRADRTVEAVRAALLGWPGRKALADTAARFETLGWSQAAEMLQRPPPPPLESGRRTRDIDETMQLQARAGQVEQLWREVGKRQEILTRTGDPVLGGLEDFHRRGLAAFPLDELISRLPAVLQAMDTRATFAQRDWVQQIGSARWLRESFVQDFSGPVTVETLARWDADIRDYYLVAPADDPRKAIDWAAPLARIDAVLTMMKTEEDALPAPSPGAPAFSAPYVADAARLRRELDELNVLPVLRKDVTQVAEKSGQLQRAFAAFSARLSVAMDELRPNPAEWLARVQRSTVGPSAALNAEWARRRGPLLAGVTTETLRADEAHFRALRGDVRRAQAFLAALDGPGGTGSVPALKLDNAPEPIAASVRTAEAARREEALAALLPRIVWQNHLPQGTPEAFLQGAEARAAYAGLQTWREQAGNFALALQQLETLLDEGRSWNEGVSALMEAWEGKPVAAQVGATGAAASLLREGRLVRSLPDERDRAVLTKHVADGRLAVALAAWRSLGRLPDWPATLPELDQEAVAVEALRTNVFAHVKDTARRVALAREIADGGKARWRRLLAAATTDELVGGVFARMEKLGLTADELNDTERFDFLLAGAKSKPWGRLPGAEASRQRDDFVAKVRQLPPAIAERPEVAALLTALQSLDLEPKEGESDPSKIGPGQAGWEGEFTDDGKQAVYRWRSPTGVVHVWEFALVEPPDGPPFYLGTKSASLGQFVGLIEARPEGKEVIAAMPAWIKDVTAGIDIDARLGPQVWRVATRRPPGRRVNDSGITLNTRWTAFVDSRWPTPLYADDAKPAAAPTWDDPMQNLPPRAAEVFAQRLLGARLPTPAEWAGVAALYGDEAKPGAAGANFSDRVWLAQRDYLVQHGNQFEFPWPDGGAFRPGLETAAKTRGLAQPYEPDVSDGHLWFAEVTQPGATIPFQHLFGNVATYLYDPASRQFFVAGGSAISPKEIDPRKSYPVDAYAEGFADVGFRPAFDAPPALIVRNRLVRLIRNQLYLR
jgi:hypothetical protein